MNMRTPRILGIIVAVTMMGAIAYGMASGRFGEELRAMLDAPWGRVTFIDLGAGLLLVGSWITWRERSIGRTVPWWIALIVTGNLASGVYVARAAWAASTVEEFLMGANSRAAGTAR